jgi:hypothetical protein
VDPLDGSCVIDEASESCSDLKLVSITTERYFLILPLYPCMELSDGRLWEPLQSSLSAQISPFYRASQSRKLEPSIS